MLSALAVALITHTCITSSRVHNTYSELNDTHPVDGLAISRVHRAHIFNGIMWYYNMSRMLAPRAVVVVVCSREHSGHTRDGICKHIIIIIHPYCILLACVCRYGSDLQGHRCSKCMNFHPPRTERVKCEATTFSGL